MGGVSASSADSALPLTPAPVRTAPPRPAGGCAGLRAAARPRPPATALLLQRNGTAPGRDPRRRPPAAGLPAGGGPERQASTSSPGRSPCEAAFRSRWPRSRPSAPALAPPQAHSSLPASPGPRGCLCWGPPGIRGPTPGASGEGPHGPGGVRSPRPRSSAPPQPTQRLSPSCPGGLAGSESAPLAARRGQLRGEGASVCASAAGEGRAEWRRPGRRAGGAGRGGAGRERGGGAAALRARGSLTRDLRLGHIAQAEALGPVDLAHFPAAPTLAGRVPAGAGDQHGGRVQQPPASGPELHGGAGGAPGRARAAPAREGQSQGPRALGWRSGGAGGLGGGDNKSRRGAGRAGREVRPLARAAPERGRRARSPGPAPGRRGAGRGGARGAGRAGRAGRGAARGRDPRRAGRPSGSRAWGGELPGSRGSADSWRRAGWRRARGRVRGPQGGPPTPSARGGDTTCGGGGGGAEAGLPPPDVTSRLPRAYQGPPRPPPAALPASRDSAPALPACALLAACLARRVPQPARPPVSAARTWPSPLHRPLTLAPVSTSSPAAPAPS